MKQSKLFYLLKRYGSSNLQNSQDILSYKNFSFNFRPASGWWEVQCMFTTKMTSNLHCDSIFIDPPSAAPLHPAELIKIATWHRQEKSHLHCTKLQIRLDLCLHQLCADTGIELLESQTFYEEIVCIKNVFWRQSVTLQTLCWRHTRGSVCSSRSSSVWVQNQNYFVDPQGEIAFRYNNSSYSKCTSVQNKEQM